MTACGVIASMGSRGLRDTGLIDSESVSASARLLFREINTNVSILMAYCLLEFWLMGGGEGRGGEIAPHRTESRSIFLTFRHPRALKWARGKVLMGTESHSPSYCRYQQGAFLRHTRRTLRSTTETWSDHDRRPRGGARWHQGTFHNCSSRALK